MFRVTIAEGGSGKLPAYLRRCLAGAKAAGLQAELSAEEAADLLILPRKKGCLLLTGGAAAALRCGMGYEDDLTLSSIGSSRSMLALQQELRALDGRLLEPQEIPLSLRSPAEPETVLAAAGALLLLGADSSDGLVLP